MNKSKFAIGKVDLSASLGLTRLSRPRRCNTRLAKVSKKKLARLHGQPLTCPDCDSARIDTRWTDDVIVYGVAGPDQVAIRCHWPVRICYDCGFMCTDFEAEEIRDKAVQDYLKAKETA